jgi:hypothetical protein
VPTANDGVKISQNNQGIQLDMVFAGKMTSQIYLQKKQMVSQFGR